VFLCEGEIDAERAWQPPAGDEVAAAVFLWRERLSQETIARILAIEQEAAKIYDDAERQAARLIEEAEKEAAVLRERILSQARQEAEQIVAAGREAAEAERSRAVTQAEAEAQRMEALAARHFDQAVNFVLDRVARHE